MFLYIVLFLLIAVAIAVFPAALAIRMKIASYFHGMQFMFLADDLPKEFKGSNYIRMNVPTSPGSKRVIRVVFVRHGQSVWNSLFNSYGASWPMRIVKAIYLEIKYFFKDPFNSVIIDSPLSSKGKNEVQEMSQFIRMAKGKVSYDINSSVIVCSNLRRAMETAVIGMGPRISTTNERILIDSSLQEGSRNIDAQTLSTEKGKIIPCKMGKFDSPQMLSTIFDASFNSGNRTSHVNVYGRMDEFILHLFGGSETGVFLPASPKANDNSELKEVIVVGHSGYFLRFFRRFLPPSSQHIAKKKKLKNCGVVAFDLVRNEITNEIMIEESSIAVLHKGF